MIAIRQMTRADVAPIAAAARQADRDEMQACAGASIEQALERGLEQSLRAWVIESDGVPLAACGDTVAGIGLGVPWMVTTDHVASNTRGFLRASKAVVGDALRRHYQLINYVDARNTAAIRWLRWLGYAVGEPVPYGVLGLLFRKFTIERGHD